MQQSKLDGFFKALLKWLCPCERVERPLPTVVCTLQHALRRRRRLALYELHSRPVSAPVDVLSDEPPPRDALHLSGARHVVKKLVGAVEELIPLGLRARVVQAIAAALHSFGHTIF